jgi:hypothetical protein
LRRLSISFSQETIWFEVGILWDARLEFPHEKLPQVECENSGDDEVWLEALSEQQH